ncbi:MAG TPA: crosslink repair DNA glycosylase YcaQ family protein [Oscillospiraceae bacterium]|nr:crosslink repair DNA glycosylase YcaQ family protein [Oscillospiraceae bacterium]HPF56035.1 crosslink repair DNA glycosylase YcaQ family protein [Clostridiales bacterium]HPK35032.1 crosslink repair DNA glycosylase YcaQ family protein [Oscillospiraceae bacterium]HPR76281.1 crosslink repair DNA glycosylase YcaQ family protein [Oscillospiraceae bacterium]
MDQITEQILRRRMHGLYLSRGCDDIVQLSHELLGLHCWFHRNVVFSALIRGAELTGWKTSLIKTWIHHALHGVAPDDLPTLLALNAGDWRWGERYKQIADRVVELMEDGIYSRAEMRLIFADEYDHHTIDRALSPWGGIFCELARLGKVAFRDMTSRDFDLIDAEPTRTPEEVLPELFERFLAAYGPATLTDAAWFFGLWRERRKELSALNLDKYTCFEYNKNVYYSIDDNTDIGDIPELTLLSGFDPLIVSYIERSAVLPPEYKSAVIMKSGICLPTIAVNGQVAGLWNIKKGEPVVEFFTTQPKRLKDAASDLVSGICFQTRLYL